MMESAVGTASAWAATSRGDTDRYQDCLMFSALPDAPADHRRSRLERAAALARQWFERLRGRSNLTNHPSRYRARTRSAEAHELNDDRTTAEPAMNTDQMQSRASSCAV